MLQLPTMPMHMLENIIANIDEDYPFSLPPKIMLITLVVMGIFIIALGLILIWYKRKVNSFFFHCWELSETCSFPSWQHPIFRLTVTYVV